MGFIALEARSVLPAEGDRTSNVSILDQITDHWAACYHEAGHAILAYEVGWWVNFEGLEVDGQEYTGLGCREIDFTPWRLIWVHLAGLMAESKLLQREPFRGRDGLYHILSDVKTGRNVTGDAGEVLRAILVQFPSATDQELINAYQEYERELWQEINHNKALWQRIDCVAKALYEKNKLTADEVEDLLLSLRIAPSPNSHMSNTSLH